MFQLMPSIIDYNKKRLLQREYLTFHLKAVTLKRERGKKNDSVAEHYFVRTLKYIDFIA